MADANLASLYVYVKEFLEVAGVYCVECLPECKFYIGSSKNIGKRWQEHIRELQANTHHSSELQRA